MKIQLTNPNLTKLCHARPGDVFRIPSKGPGEQLFLLCRHDIGKPDLRKQHLSNGLYSEENPLFAVNLETGEASILPHLSSGVEIVRNVALCTVDE